MALNDTLSMSHDHLSFPIQINFPKNPRIIITDLKHRIHFMKLCMKKVKMLLNLNIKDLETFRISQKCFVLTVSQFSIGSYND